MNSIEANIRDNSTKGQLNAIRNSGNVPAIIYGGKDKNQKISISKKLLKTFIEKENFFSNIITLNVDGSNQNVLPREIKYHILTDEPITVDEVVFDTPSVAVSFTFSGDCWVNIYDATGERIAWGIKKLGYVMNITGQAPFNITLGKPELVVIDFDGQAIDMSQFREGQIAKFTLPLAP